MKQQTDDSDHDELLSAGNELSQELTESVENQDENYIDENSTLTGMYMSCRVAYNGRCVSGTSILET